MYNNCMTDDTPQDHTAFTAFGQFAALKPEPKIRKGHMHVAMTKDGDIRQMSYVLTDEEFLSRINNAPDIDPCP